MRSFREQVRGVRRSGRVGRWVSRGWLGGGQGSGEGEDSEVLSVGTSDISSDYDPTDHSDEKSDADVNVLYWSTMPAFDVPGLRNLMSRNQFLSILVNQDRRDDPRRDRLFKIRSLLSRLIKALQEAYYPNREICLDSKWEATCQVKRW